MGRGKEVFVEHFAPPTQTEKHLPIGNEAQIVGIDELFFDLFQALPLGGIGMKFDRCLRMGYQPEVPQGKTKEDDACSGRHNEQKQKCVMHGWIVDVRQEVDVIETSAEDQVEVAEGFATEEVMLKLRKTERGCVERTERKEETELKEITVIQMANAVVDPRAVMILVQYASSTDGAVMGTGRFWKDTFAANILARNNGMGSIERYRRWQLSKIGSCSN